MISDKSHTKTAGTGLVDPLRTRAACRRGERPRRHMALTVVTNGSKIGLSRDRSSVRADDARLPRRSLNR